MDHTEKRNIEEELEDLASRMNEKVVVSVDHINWEEAAKDLKWAILIKLASGRPNQKQTMEDVLSRVWKLSGPATFLKVEKDTILVNFKT